MLFGKYVNKFYLRYWYDFLIGILMLVIVDVAQLEIPTLVGNLVDILNLQKGQDVYNAFWNGSVTDPNSFMYFIVAMIVIGVLIFIGRMGWRFAINGLGTNIDFDLRDQMFSYAERLSVSYYKTQKTGTMMAYFNNDLEQVKSAFTDGLIFIIDGLVMGGIALYKLFRISWVMSLVCVLPLSIIALTGGIIGKVIEKKYNAQLTSYDNLSDFTQENFSGISVIKAFVRERHQASDFKKKSLDYKEKNLGYLRFMVALDAADTFLINSIFVAAVFIGGYLICYESGSLTPGQFTTFLGLLDSLIWPMFAIAQLVSLISRSYASLKVVTKFMDSPIDLKDVDKPLDGEGKITGDILFKDLDFSYPDSPSALVLKKIDVHIRKGENIGIVGRTGSGKSTLVKILLKIYNIDDNHLFFDGVDINNIPAKTIRSNIGYVAQNAFLFSDLIKNNIAFSNEDVSQKTVQKAAEFACVSKSINEFKNGYDTLIGEKGTTLSGGQKQRIAMARAIVNNPPILILDDSVSAVDSDTEKQILSNIKDLRKGKTTFIVSSRISSVESLDKIIVMDQGSIVGYGNHSQLIENCPYYAETVRLQELEKEEKSHE